MLRRKGDRGVSMRSRQEEREEIGRPLRDDVKESEGIFNAGSSNDVANELIFDSISGRVRKESIFHPLTLIGPLYCVIVRAGLKVEWGPGKLALGEVLGP